MWFGLCACLFVGLMLCLFVAFIIACFLPAMKFDSQTLDPGSSYCIELGKHNNMELFGSR